MHASATAGVFGLERHEADHTFRVRVLDGAVQMSSPFGAREVQKGQMALVRSDASTFAVESLPEGQAQREWDLRSTALPERTALRSAP